MNKLRLAQLVLNSASCNVLKDLNNRLLGNIDSTEGDEDDE